MAFTYVNGNALSLITSGSNLTINVSGTAPVQGDLLIASAYCNQLPARELQFSTLLTF